MWWLTYPVAAAGGAAWSAWWVRRRWERALAAEQDRSSRQVFSARAEVVQLRRGYAELEQGLAEVPVVQAATAVVEDALQALQEGER